jgi:hypothetical protein
MVLATAGVIREMKTKREGTQRQRQNRRYCKRQRGTQPHRHHETFAADGSKRESSLVLRIRANPAG